MLVVLYKAGDAAKNPHFLGCAENALGLREMLEKEGHTVVVTDNKEPEGDSGTALPMKLLCSWPCDSRNCLISMFPSHPVLSRLYEGMCTALCVLATHIRIPIYARFAVIIHRVPLS